MGLGPYGTYDTAGNVREWCASQAHQSQDRFIQGGAWNEEPRNFVRARSIDPFDRSNTNGFRCIKPYEPAITVRTPPDRSERLNTSTAAFERFQKIFEFENTPFREQIEEIELHDPRFDCKKISLDSPWGEDRSKIFFLEPKRAQPPYQTILWLPSFWAYSLESFEKHFGQIRCRFDFLLRSGRAVAVMAMPGMYGRPPFDVEIPSDANERIAGLRRERSGSLEKFKERIFHRRSLTISVVREVKRLVDFLVEYPGIDSEKIGYHSVSLGGVLGPVIAANEQRISAAVWGFGGLGDEDLLPEIDPAVYLPRVTIPVLQLNAQYDYVFDRDNSSRPWLEYLGTDANSKRQLLYESGHSGPTESIMNRDSVAWLDLHLGRVATVS